MVNRQMQNKVQNDAVSDTTGDAISTKAGEIKILKKAGHPNGQPWC